MRRVQVVSFPRAAALAVPLLAGSLLFGCRGGTASGGRTQGSASRSGVRIGVSLLTRTHPFYQELEAGLSDEAKARGYALNVQSGEFDVARQKDQIENFIVDRVSAIVVSPCDSRSIGTSIQAANRAGIPVFTADIAVLSEGAAVVSHIASDNVAGGRLAARALAGDLGERGKIAIIDHPEVESVIQRVAGFEEEMKSHPGIHIVAKLSGRGMKEAAFRTAEDILQAHPDLDGIFGINDDSALGALAAVEKAGRLGRVKIVGFDAVPEARQAIRDGKIAADVVQQPRAIGEETIRAVAAYIAGESVPPVHLIPCKLYTKGEALGGS